MKFTLLLLLLTYAPFGLFAQQVYGSSGGSIETNNFKVSYTLGESFIGTSFYQGKTVAIGFHQIDFQNPVTISESELTGINFYPNPINNQLYIVNENSSNQMNIMICQINGVDVQHYKISSGEAIDCSKLVSGTYLLTICTELSVNQYKIIKL